MALVGLHQLAPALLAGQPLALPLLHTRPHRLRPLHAFQSQPSTPGWKDPKTLDKLTDWATAGAYLDPICSTALPGIPQLTSEMPGNGMGVY